MRDTNRQLLLAAARLLRPLVEDLVFVGGCATGLLITDDAAAGVRATVDVDAIAEITSYPEYLAFSGRLRFGDSWPKPLPDGVPSGPGSDMGALIAQGLPSRAQRAPRKRADFIPQTG
jgi:hypothetical protein